MKRVLCVACVTVALSVNAVPTNAQSGRNTFVEEVVRGILIEIGSEAALELLRVTFSSRPEERRDAFTDGEYLVSIGKNGDDFSYYGVNLETRDSITLRGVTILGNDQRQVYAWYNNNYRYQVAWRPNDPQVIRLQVFDGTGNELLNRLLYKTDS